MRGTVCPSPLKDVCLTDAPLQLFQAVDIVHPTSRKVTATLILGLVKCIHVRNDVLNERGVVDYAKLKPVGRLGDISYARVGDAFRLPRLAWKLEGEKIGEFLKGVEQTRDAASL